MLPYLNVTLASSTSVQTLQWHLPLFSHPRPQNFSYVKLKVWRTKKIYQFSSLKLAITRIWWVERELAVTRLWHLWNRSYQKVGRKKNSTRNMPTAILFLFLLLKLSESGVLLSMCWLFRDAQYRPNVLSSFISEAWWKGLGWAVGQSRLNQKLKRLVILRVGCNSDVPQNFYISALWTKLALMGVDTFEARINGPGCRESSEQFKIIGFLYVQTYKLPISNTPIFVCSEIHAPFRLHQLSVPGPVQNM